MQTHTLKCFGAHPGAGNLAQVIEQDGWLPEARQAYAAQQNVQACVFVGNIGDAASPLFSIDYYYPHTRSPLCLHATLAVAHVLFSRYPEHAAISLKTAMHGQLLQLSKGETGYNIALAQQTAPRPTITAAQVDALLNGKSMRIAAASIGSPKLLVEVKDSATLNALQPDLAAITAWANESKINGIYAYTQRADGSYEGRNFNHLDPAMEDKATGVAAGALAVHLQRSVTVHQGGDCLIQAHYSPTAIQVGGAAQFA